MSIIRYEATSVFGVFFVSNYLADVKTAAQRMYPRIHEWSDMDADGVYRSYDRYGRNQNVNIVSIEQTTQYPEDYIFIVCANGIPMGVYESMENAVESVRIQAQYMGLECHLGDTNHAHVRGKIGDTNIIIQSITKGPHSVGPIWS